jgi:predicted TIM-barrel fold metal-dependent hydrolase
MHAHLFIEEFHHQSFVAPSWDRGVHTAGTDAEGSAAADQHTGRRYWGPLDPDGSEHIRRMDEAGIEQAVLLHIDLGGLFGDTEMSIENQNKYVSEVARKHPGRFIWFCGVDPRRKDAVEIFERCVTEWGAQGLKLYPTAGFLPADKEVYPLYERASAWKLPVYVHMGPENPPYKNEGNAHAAVLLRVLVDFPDLTVVVAHLGFEFWRDLIALGKVCENVRCDFCAWQRIAKDNYGQFCYILRTFLYAFGKERVMFGTDAPLVEDAMTSKEWVELVTALPRQAPAHRFTYEEVSALLEGNAKRLLAP